jgi:hypothetical protein
LANNVSDAVQGLLTGKTPDVDTSAPVDTGNNGGGASTTTTSPTGGTTPTTAAPANATAAELLRNAQSEFDAANAALAKSPPDFSAYGQHYRAAQQFVIDALTKLGGSATTTTSSPPAPTTTAAP